MKALSFAVASVAFAGSATVAAAQSGTTCPAGAGPASPATITQDACQKTLDLFRFIAPQLGTAIAGGNATLGQGGTLGGLGKFTVGLRLNVVDGSLPQLDNAPVATGREATEFVTERAPVPMPIADLALGVFKGIPLGVTNVGGIDALVNLAYLPEYAGADVKVTVSDGSVKLGYGVRLGIVQESIVVPGVSVTYMKRDLPKVTIIANADQATFNINELDLQTTAWRVTANKKFLVFGAAIGAGQDRYESSATAQGEYAGFTSEEVRLDQKLTRTNYFANLSLNLPVFKLIGEIGQVSGGDVQTFNTFKDHPADESLLYYSAGFRLSF